MLAWPCGFGRGVVSIPAARPGSCLVLVTAVTRSVDVCVCVCVYCKYLIVPLMNIEDVRLILALPSWTERIGQILLGMMPVFLY